jgi:ankyrin repeat protein
VWRNDAAAVSCLLSSSPPLLLLEAVDSESGWTPLARALYFGHLRIAAALLAAGASDVAGDAKARARLRCWGGAAACARTQGCRADARRPLRPRPSNIVAGPHAC